VSKPPPNIDGARVLKFADLTSSSSTGKTRHVAGESEVADFAGLAIAQYPSDPGFYLFYCDENWKAITDTYHETLDAAIDQAEFEFEPVEFSEVGSNP
jgi:hypothetical protein